MDTSSVVILDWDTQFFEFRIGRVIGERLTARQASAVDEWCTHQEVRCLYFLCTAQDYESTQAAEQAGFHLVDIRMTFTRKLSEEIRPRGGSEVARVRPYRAEDVSTLEQIARVSHRDTRFSVDPNFPAHLSDELYATWIRRSCEGYAQQVFVATQDEHPVGYIACHYDQAHQTGQIGLVAVTESARGRGIGSQLTNEALLWFQTEGAKEIVVVTQGRNYAAQNLYQRLGFVTTSISLWYHKWFNT